MITMPASQRTQCRSQFIHVGKYHKSWHKYPQNIYKIHQKYSSIILIFHVISWIHYDGILSTFKENTAVTHRHLNRFCATKSIPLRNCTHIRIEFRIDLMQSTARLDDHYVKHDTHGVNKSSAPQYHTALIIYGACLSGHWVATAVFASIPPHRTSKENPE